MSELTQKGGSKYTDEQRKLAAVMYAQKGTISRVAQELEIPERTIHDWVKTEWFETIVTEVRTQNKDQHIAMYQQIMEKAEAQVLAKLPDSSARDAMIIAATAQDKARILMALPNAYSADSGSVSALARQFAELSQQWEEKQSRVVATQNGSHIEAGAGAKNQDPE